MAEVSSNKVAIITGGSRGVGAATARLLASKGWNITITCTSSMDDAENVVKECEKLGVEAIAITADVSEDNSCVQTAQETIEKWGRIDALVNNAGTTKFVFNHADLDGLDAEDFLHIYKVNVVGPFQMVRACKEMLLNSDNPSVVNISSIAGIKGLGSSLAYASSKGALNTMTKSMARNLGPIRVNAICPGYVKTKLSAALLEFEGAEQKLMNSVSLGRAGTTDEMAGLAILLASDAGSYITGASIINDGGLMNAPFF